MKLKVILSLFISDFIRRTDQWRTGIVSYWYEEVSDCYYLHVINGINNNSHLLGLTICQRLTVSALQVLPPFNLKQP